VELFLRRKRQDEELGNRFLVPRGDRSARNVQLV
jgi:hypothetical protein